MYSAYLRCSGLECAKTYEPFTPIFRCPSCDRLLTVVHDVKALREQREHAWKGLFSERAQQFGALSHDPHTPRSGVWTYHEWVMPWVERNEIVSTGEGRTPLFFAARAASEFGLSELYVKQSGTSHTGSFKDLGMTVLVSVVSQAKKIGKLDVRAIACASTGDTSASLAAYGAIAGLPVIVLLPKGLVSTAQLVQPLANGAKVFALDTDFDGCMRIVSELAKRGLLYLANSMNPLRIEGQKTVAFEIAHELGWSLPDWVVLPSGNLGNASALYAGFKLMHDLGVTDRMPRLLIAQAEAANPMYTAYKSKSPRISPQSARETLATAIRIGAPVSAERAMIALKEMNGVVYDASEDELANAAARADRAGLYTCPQTGVAFAALEKAIAAGDVKKDERVVVVSTAHGLKFTEFKQGYAEGKLRVESRLKNAPIEMAADVDKIAAALE